MTAYAHVRDGAVSRVETISPGEPLLRDRYHPDVLKGFVALGPADAQRVRPGWLWDGLVFSPPPAPGPAPRRVPAAVTNFQARAVLMGLPGPGGAGSLFDAVDAALRAEGGPAWQAWEYANEFTRGGELLARMAEVFGLSAERLDELFLAASEVEA